ncbi:sugar ABC transporter ATP-binding protein [Treponema primitia]|uniref:sugar ABC transporter ATP-binding protein n=1 Tax=Treponema primitia TaxID=88058 RepID=UPI003980BF62
MTNCLMSLDHISKSFLGVKVLKDVSFNVNHHEVHALMGENGAGKSTLMKILMGIHTADSGTISMNGSEIINRNPKEAMFNGIVMIHQELNPVLDMQVFENIYLGRELKTKIGLVDKRAMKQESKKLLDNLSIDIPVNAYMRDLSVAQCQLIEIIKAISVNAKIVIMDEPTSAVTDREVAVLFEQIKKLKESGVSIIYISHKLVEIFKICDRVTVLRDGTFVGTEEVSNVTGEELIKMMVGRDIKDVFPKADVQIGDTLLEIKNFTLKQKFHNVNFSLRRGEILGITGLVGAGRSELVETIFGIHKKTEGEIFIRGKLVQIRKPADAIRNKIALITEDRKRSGLNLSGTVYENISMVALRRFINKGIINKKHEKQSAEEYIKILDVKTSGSSMLVKYLSGGNQQKVVLAKWLLTESDIIIFDEPTRGIDIGTKRDIYLLIGEFVKQGKSVIVISSEMPEVMGLSDRIIVMSAGYVTGELLRNEFSQANIMKLAIKLVKE